ncbi:voltage-gated potassium channel protein [Endozoicomonas sp. ONNA2]|uniref:voltage-gated potassium channel protein n=1 Tax=Endozoicomonas sp. ONNA2 TaxID=2828741 RepID=UPI002147FEFF|nr:voltage-gated potassium channel protein [Endozoicomonas sp. ONNA2]
MDNFTHLWQKFMSLWLEYRHSFAALAVFTNGVLIFKTIWGMPVNLLDLFHINNLVDIEWAEVADGPWFLLGVFLMLNALGMLYRARIAWAVSVFLLIITLTFTMHFYPMLWTKSLFCGATLVGILLLGRDFSHSSATAGGIFAIISFSILLFYGSYGSLYFGTGFAPEIDNLVTAFYFSIVTMTTVGYGDIIPKSESARLFTVSMIIAGITVFATSLTTIFAPVIRSGIGKLVKGRERTMNRAEHFIVCGTSILALGTISQLMQRGLNLTVVTVRPEDEFSQIEQKAGQKLDLISGDSTDSAVLDGAGLMKCRALLALTDDDAANAFIVLTAREMNPEIRTVLVVNDAKNMKKVRQVKADVILSPQLFGSEILASVLSGETLDHDKLTSMLLTSGHGLFD